MWSEFTSQTESTSERTRYVDPHGQVQSVSRFSPLVLLLPYTMDPPMLPSLTSRVGLARSHSEFERAVPTCHLSTARFLSSFFFLTVSQSRYSGITMSAIKESPSPPAACLYDAGLASQVLLPSDADYAVREDSYWCNDSKLGPACIVRPRSAKDVSTALKAIVSTEQKFAVRSGGHTNWAGANNIANGVTVFKHVLPPHQWIC